MRKPFRKSVLVFSALGLLAFLTLDGNRRLAAVVILGSFAAKNWLAELRRRSGR
jgi:hypothetical protein